MTKKLFLVAAFIIAVSGLFFSPGFAATYSWVDDNGVFHITDYPKPVKREEPKQSAPGPAAPADVIAPVPATAFSSAGTPTLKPAAPVSQLTPTRGGSGAMATSATVSQMTTTAALPAKQEQPRTSLPVPQEPQKIPEAGIMALVMAPYMIILVLFVGMYVYFSLCLFLIAKKLNVSAPWTAWIPLVQIWTLLQAAGKPLWWFLLFLIPLVGIIVIAYVWMCIVENLGRNKWLGLLILVPIFSLVYIGVLAFSKQEQQSESSGQSDKSGQEWKPT
jgi:hypothetical protein